ncbi:class V aminotransferase [Bacillus sp. J14TS2]|uniref:pyridoxal-phosphate-dependent aminotransferase family protein n=1 Tax=Bacillus sp. J14TS2 TaxID=2807188 RepID=UPI001B26B474|nr:alanine--glyoxylate aminotransferase family protein [Bacillus sp. J14TS2]GIN73778.1 class V aminotransferase [Bacillus sp. J14TS2]
MYKNILRTPGPTPVPEQVKEAMNHDMISHRSEEFVQLFHQAAKQIKPFFGTEQDVYIITGSGTSVLEAAVVNTISSGDEVAVVSIGTFGDRFVSICKKYGAVVHKLEIEWGKACTGDELAQFLKQYKNIKAVFATYNETSTGVLNPIEDLANAVHMNSDALFIVDGVSCIGGVPAQMDEWGIDILVTGSQKAMMLPPGLAFICVSEKAWSVIDNNHALAYYLDLKQYREWYKKGMTPNTPAVSLIYGLSAACEMIEKEGLDQTVHRHQLLKSMVREAMSALKFPILTNEQDGSPTVTAVCAPPEINVDELCTHLKKKYHLDLAGGLGKLEGKIFRFGHMGYCFPGDILEAVSLIECALGDLNYSYDLGAGVKAAQKVYSSYVK